MITTTTAAPVGTDTLSIFLRTLRELLERGAASIDGIAVEVLEPARDAPRRIGFVADDGVALLPQAALAAVRDWRRTRYRQEFTAGGAAIAGELQRAGHLRRWSTGRRDYQLRHEGARVRVWYVDPAALGVAPAPPVPAAPQPPEEPAPQRATGADERPASAYYRDGFGFYVPQALSSVDARMIEALRFIGRIRYATRPYVYRFIYPDRHPTTAFRALRYLLAHDLLWEVPGRQAEFVLGMPVQAPTAHRGRRPTIYGLTERGKAWLIERELAGDDGVEADERHARVLKARDLARRPLPSRTMSHDMQVAWWLASALTALKYNRWCRSVYVETEFTVTEDQRIDAYLDIRLNLNAPRTDIRTMPWNQGDLPGADDLSVKIALEIDNGTEAPRVIYLKGWAYANLTYNRVYDWLFRGPIMPVFIAPTVERKATIMHEFAQIWPLNWGICATSKRCHSPLGGTLWGVYHRMNELPLDQPPEELGPLSLLSHSPDRTVSWRPAITDAQWVLGMVNPRTGRLLVDER